MNQGNCGENSPIGIFDSGVGGLSVFKEIYQLLPLEKFIYLADKKNAPYGQKTDDEIFRLSCKTVEQLLGRDCKLIVVACNTATTAVIGELRKKYNVDFVGTKPDIETAVSNSSVGRIGVLATESTLASKAFSDLVDLYANHTELITVAGKGLVEAIELGKINDESTYRLLKDLLKPVLKQEIDYLVLGCTHYAFLEASLKNILPKQVKIIDSAKIVAQKTKSVLTKKGALAIEQQSKPVFYSNKNPEILNQFLNTEQYKSVYLDF